MKTYIQIGTNDGNDTFNKMCSNLSEKSRIVLIEPHKTLKSEIEKNYSEISKKHDIIIVNKAIVTQENIKNIDLYFVNLNDAVSSVINRKSFDLFSNKINVDSITVNSLLKELNIIDVEEFHVDAEGLDYEILLSIDLKKFNIKLITCEIWPYNDDDKNGVYRTGESMMELINEKYFDYTVSRILIDEMPSLKFVKK